MNLNLFFIGCVLGQPVSSNLACKAITISPLVGAAMNDRTIRDIEDFIHGDGEKSESAELGMFLEIIIFVSAYKNRASLQSS